MKILVTGANGFVGAAVVRALVGAGDNVIGLVRAESDRRRLAGIEGARFVEGDITTEEGRRAAAAVGAEACVHTAWYVAPRLYLAAYENLEMQTATLQLARCLFAARCRRFVGVGTCFEYDTDAGYLSEKTPLAPAHLYSAIKAGTYLALRQLAALGGATLAWARLFYMYGPDEPPGRLVPAIARALLRGEEATSSPGHQVRDFLHIDDVGSALAAVAKADVVDAVNVGSGEPVTVGHIVRLLGELSGRPELVRLGAVPYGARDPMFVCADNSKLRAHTDWKPRWELAGGLADAVRFWRGEASNARA
jgi:nucleoside-diphosphate-sugar epimerase